MAKTELTGIERQLVLDYLIDGNVPVTITPVQNQQEETTASSKKVPKDSSRIFPVALRSEQLTVLNQGIILLKDAPKNVQAFDGKQVCVQFYFNKLGLYFITTIKRTKNALALVIPDAISRIHDTIQQHNSDMNAVLYFEAGERTGTMHIACMFHKDYPLFTQPKWSDVEESRQKEAKAYLEKAVAKSRADGKTLGNGLFLIPVCRYLAHSSAEIKSIENRTEPPAVLYINHERIVFGFHKGGYSIQENSEYALKLGFPLENGPVKERVMYVTCYADTTYQSNDGEIMCAVCRYTSLKKEDERFLYEMQKKL